MKTGGVPLLETLIATAHKILSSYWGQEMIHSIEINVALLYTCWGEVRRAYFKCMRSSYIIQINLLGLNEAEYGKHQNLFLVIVVGSDQTLCAVFSHFNRALQVLRCVQHPAHWSCRTAEPNLMEVHS